MSQTEKLIRLPQVLAIVPCARSTWWAWVKRGVAPQPVRLSRGFTCWRPSEVEAFVRGEWLAK